MMNINVFSKIIGVTGGLVMLLVSPMFFSCSESSPEIVQAYPSIVFEYSDFESLPDVSMYLFLKTSSDNRRSESFVVRSMENPMEFEWRISAPKIFSLDDNMYVFASKLKSIQSGGIPNGRYNVLYYDSAGNEADIDFRIAYDEKFVDMKASDFLSSLRGGVENIALYDEYNQLFFLEKPKSNWKIDADILSDQKRAVFKRNVYFTTDNRIVCLMPIEKMNVEDK